MQAPILNLAAYQFHPIENPAAHLSALKAQGDHLGIRGTLLLSPEGLNGFWAAPEAAAEAFLNLLRGLPGFESLEAKASWSVEQPFKRFKVKVKAEIIRMNHPTIAPWGGRAPAISSQTLARWLDQGHDDDGRPVLMLDTRNGFEVDHGRFEGAIDWRIEKFTEFPAAVSAHQDGLKGATVVSYCTGGIRCEKAALFMRSMGLDHVYQLDGGILKYFEETDGRHWVGDCFVFDERVALSPSLEPSPEKSPSTDNDRPDHTQ
ncbi:MAG: hypothetical protein RIR74_1144 [Pseudomonadota bacterium]